MNTIDWKIHKKLLDAGGLGPVVYIMPNRFNGCTFRAWKQIIEHEAKGRTVLYARPTKRKRYSEPFIDYDILTLEQCERAERIWNEYWRERRNGT